MAKKQFEFTGGVWRETRKPKPRLGVKLLVLGVVGVLAWTYTRPAPSTAVTLVAAQRKDLGLWVKSMGNVQAARSVVVRTAVAGQITEILFSEGQNVKQGDVLARIDPTLYKAQLAQAQANKAQDEAQLAATRAQLKQLAGAKNARSQALQAAVQQFEAAIKSDAATIAQAQAQLDYTTITAPIDGRVGIKRIDAGNMLHPEDKDGLVEITQMDTVTVVFPIAEQNLPTISAAAAQSKSLPVVVSDAKTGETLGQGSLQFTDNQVDPATGALRVKAQLDNTARKLWPGAVVRVQLGMGSLPNALVVPAASLLRRGEETFVYKVDAEKKNVALLPVHLLATQDNEAAIEGINAGDRVAVQSATALAANIKPLNSLSPAR